MYPERFFSAPSAKMVLLDLLFTVIQCVVFLYDVVTFPVYSATRQSWKERTKQNLGPVRPVRQ